MASTTKSHRQKTSRKQRTTGRDRVYTVRLPNDLVTNIDDWARANGYGDRSSAIRAMIKTSLGRVSVRPLLGIDDVDQRDEPIADAAKSYAIERGLDFD